MARIALKQISRSGSVSAGASSGVFESSPDSAEPESPIGPVVETDGDLPDEPTLPDWSLRRTHSSTARSRSQDVSETLAELEAKVEALEEETRAEANLFPVSEEVTRPEDDPRIVIHYPTYFRPYPHALRKQPMQPPAKGEFGSIQALSAPLYVPPTHGVPAEPVAGANLRKPTGDLPVVLAPALAEPPRPGLKPVSEVVAAATPAAQSAEATPLIPSQLAPLRRAPTFGPSHVDSTAPTSFSDFPPLRRRTGVQTVLAWLGAAAVVALLAFGTVTLFERSDGVPAPMVSSATTTARDDAVRPPAPEKSEGRGEEASEGIPSIDAAELRIEAGAPRAAQSKRRPAKRPRSTLKREDQSQPAAERPSWKSDPFATAEAQRQQVQLTQDQVKNALAGGAARARSCASAEGPSGQGTVRVVFDPQGGVMRATVLQPRFRGTEVGRCVERAFAIAKTPPYSGGTLSTTYPFRVSKMVSRP